MRSARCSLIGCAARCVSRLSVASRHGVIVSQSNVTASFLAATLIRKTKRATQPQPINVMVNWFDTITINK